MKLVGLGCSFTYGSELVDPALQDTWDEKSQSTIWDRHYKNTSYRNKHCWLGLLAEMLNCDFDNRAEPANSNFAIQNQIADYILNLHNPEEHIVICVAWTERNRMSWYDGKWTHNGFVEDDWSPSLRDWITHSTTESNSMYTDNARLFVNSLCKAQGIPILQFNALGNHSTTNYPNYFMDGENMINFLTAAQSDNSSLNLIAPGLHPNEDGHRYWTIRLHDYAKERII